MSSFGGIEGYQGAGELKASGTGLASRSATSNWNQRKIVSFGERLEGIAEKVMQSTASGAAFLEQEGTVRTLVSELAELVHLLDESSKEGSQSALIELREKVSVCVKAINQQLESKLDLPDNLAVQQVRQAMTRLELENDLKLQALKEIPLAFAISSNKGISDNLEQVCVLNQYADTTASGFENCGYHALKNALVALVPAKSAAELEKMFNDKELFLAFYKTYCVPVLAASPAMKGKADASVPLLREIIARVRSDENPPAALRPLHQALTNSFEEDSLAIFQMSTTTGDDRGEPLFGFYDEKGSFEAKKLYDLATRPGPRTLSCVFGNEVLGHWYTLTIHKGEDGSLQMLGMDSMDNSHDNLGIFSALGKMSRLVESKIAVPEEFLKEAFSPIHDFISPRANWFEADGSIGESYAESLLDNTPVPTLASEEAPNGSTLERNIAQCRHAFALMRDAGWLGSSDYWIQKQVEGLEMLVGFYAARLPLLHPDRAQMLEIAAHISVNKRAHIVEETFESALSELETRKENMTAYRYEKARSTFTQIAGLYRERKQMAKVSDESERISAMNAIKGVNGVEPGFTNGTKATDIEKSLMEKVDTLLMAYQEAMRRGQLDKMVETIASGDGCLTARMGRIVTLYAQFRGLGNIEETFSAEKVKDAPMTALSEAIDEMASDFITDKAEQFTSLISAENITVSPNVVADSLKEYALGDLGSPFREFLLAEKIVQTEGEEIDWQASLPAVLENREKIVKFVMGNKDERFGIEAKGYIRQLSAQSFLQEAYFETVAGKFAMYASGQGAEPFRKYLLDKGVIPDLKVSDWEKTVRTVLQLEDCSVWLNYAKGESLKYF